MAEPESHRYRQVAESFGGRPGALRPGPAPLPRGPASWHWVDPVAGAAKVLAGAGAALEEMGGRFTVNMITVAITAAARPGSV